MISTTAYLVIDLNTDRVLWTAKEPPSEGIALSSTTALMEYQRELPTGFNALNCFNYRLSARNNTLVPVSTPNTGASLLDANKASMQREVRGQIEDVAVGIVGTTFERAVREQRVRAAKGGNDSQWVTGLASQLGVPYESAVEVILKGEEKIDRLLLRLDQLQTDTLLSIDQSGTSQELFKVRDNFQLALEVVLQSR